ncbi:hypothetical protein D3C85_638410 [compost metagenome]
MKINIENAAKSGNADTVRFTLETVVENLKELRDRTDKGDMAALDEFFAVFTFSDGKTRARDTRHHDREVHAAKRGEALHAIGVALGLTVGADLITACVPAINSAILGEKAPWPDFAGQIIRHGDRLAHPDGNSFIAVKLKGHTDSAAWRAVYDREPHGRTSSLGLQIGDKGRAVVIEPKSRAQ